MPIQGLDKSLNACLQWAVTEANTTAKKVLDVAKEGTPVVTGTLLAGWELTQATVSNPSAEVANNVPYAGYVEDGTEHMKGEHMLANAKNSI